MRTAETEDPMVERAEFLTLLSILYPEAPNWLLYIDDSMKFPNGALRLHRLLRYCYLYPVVVQPIVAAQKALRRRVFGLRFWERR